MRSRLPGENIYYLFQSFPFANFGMEICYMDNLKSIIARSLKLGQVIEDDE